MKDSRPPPCINKQQNIQNLKLGRTYKGTKSTLISNDSLINFKFQFYIGEADFPQRINNEVS